MGVLGVGVDMIEVARFRGCEKDANFLAKFLSEEEQREALTRQEPAPTLAGRFAAKEAVIKAMGSAFPDRPIFFRDIVVQNSVNGAPLAHLTCKHFENIQISLSISHCREYAIAFAVIAHQDDTDERRSD